MSARRSPAGVLVLRGFQLTLAMTIALAAVWGLLGGCREQSTAPIDRNLGPETFITFAPGDSQKSFYAVDLHWYGSDKDGAAIAFDVAVTESLPKIEDVVWHRTTRHDSLIICPVEETREILGHRFYVRAIDNEGKVDPTPAWIFFGSADNIPPTVNLTGIRYNPITGETKDLDPASNDPAFPTDTIPTGWGVRLKWTGRDDSQLIGSGGDTVTFGRVSRFYYRLLPIESAWLGGDTIKTNAEYTADYFDLHREGATYAFEVRAVDDGGLSGSGTATLSFLWNKDPVARIFPQFPYDPAKRGHFMMNLAGGALEEHVSGDTLPIYVPGQTDLPSISLVVDGKDPDPVDGDSTVASIEWRYTSGALMNPWQPHTTGRIEITGLMTGDYTVMARATDRLGRVQANPERIVFMVNKIPKFIRERDLPGGVHFVQAPLDSITVMNQADIVAAQGVVCNLMASDPDTYAGSRLLYGYRFAAESSEYTTPLSSVNPETPVTFKALSPTLGYNLPAGDYRFYIMVKDNAGDNTRGSRILEERHVIRVVE
jgi:hypothetical protein